MQSEATQAHLIPVEGAEKSNLCDRNASAAPLTSRRELRQGGSCQALCLSLFQFAVCTLHSIFFPHWRLLKNVSIFVEVFVVPGGAGQVRVC